MRDHVHRGRFGFGLAFEHGRAQPRIGTLFGGIRQIDDGEIRCFASQLQRFLARFGRPGQKYDACVRERVFVERFDDRGFIADTGQGAFLRIIFGDEAKVHGGFGIRREIANLTAEQRLAAHQRDARVIKGPSPHFSPALCCGAR